MTGIYKIENKINGKIYIGQSIHIQRRWMEHCKPSTHSVISNAIKKYGKENFSFEVLEECSVEELNEKELYYIHKYNSIIPKGYNVIDNINGQTTSYIFYSPEVLQNIIKDLEECKLTIAQIAEKYSINKSTVSRINTGKIHIQEDRVYPIRLSLQVLNAKKRHKKKKNRKIKRIKKIEKSRQFKIKKKEKVQKKNCCCDCGKIITHGAKRCPACYQKSQRIVDRPNREELKLLIRSTSFTTIGKKFNVSDNTIRKWCKFYGLPFKAREIKTYTNKEWENI